MKKEELAALLNGREYGDEMTKAEQEMAREAELVVVFGASDDLIEFQGAIHDEAGAGTGAKVFLNRQGLLPDHENPCECAFCGYAEAQKKCAVIESIWCDGSGWSWSYHTDIPHATFEIVENGEPYCQGIVFELTALP